MLKAESTGQCGIITVSGQNLREHTRGNQQVLQLCYKKLTCYIIIYSVIFQHTLLQHRCIFSTFLLGCLCLENRIFCFESQTMPQQRSSVIHRL